jgi:hypothetical protein
MNSNPTVNKLEEQIGDLVVKLRTWSPWYNTMEERRSIERRLEDLRSRLWNLGNRKN